MLADVFVGGRNRSRSLWDWSSPMASEASNRRHLLRPSPAAGAGGSTFGSTKVGPSADSHETAPTLLPGRRLLGVLGHNRPSEERSLSRTVNAHRRTIQFRTGFGRVYRSAIPRRATLVFETTPRLRHPFSGVPASAGGDPREWTCPSGRRRRSRIILASDSLSGSRQSNAQARTRSIVSVRVMALASAIASMRASSGTENRRLVETLKSRCSVPSGNSLPRSSRSLRSVCERFVRFELIATPP